jgi:monoamine oxidase
MHGIVLSFGLGRDVMPRTPLFAGAARALTRARQALPDAPEPGPRAVSRRAALLMLSATAAAACTPKVDTGSPDAPSTVIVGGGTAGLTAAWRIAAAGHQVAIYESSSRTGGRMFTQRDFTPEGQFCELGGELVDSDHTVLINLCKELGIGIQRLRPEGTEPSDIYDFGGKVRTISDLLDPVAQTGAFVPVAARIANDHAALLDTQGEWTPRGRELDALPLSKYLDSLKNTTEPWVLAFLSCAYVGEYGLPLEQQSSLNLVDFIGLDTATRFSIFGDSDESHRIAGGSGTLPETLTARLMTRPLSARATINLRSELTHIARDGAGFKLTFKTPDGVKTISARRVVLTLPFTRLRTVEGLGSLGLSAAKMKAINELGYGANAKLMVATRARPWSDAGLFGINAPLSGSIYTDRGFQQIWDTSAGQPGKGGVITNFLADANAKGEESPALAALEAGLKSLSPELAATLNPELRASFFWPRYPHTLASYSAAKVGQYASMIETAAATELNGALLFGGEHTSIDFNGFMNGAVDSGERVARELLAAS